MQYPQGRFCLVALPLLLAVACTQPAGQSRTGGSGGGSGGIGGAAGTGGNGGSGSGTGSGGQAGSGGSGGFAGSGGSGGSGGSAGSGGSGGNGSGGSAGSGGQAGSGGLAGSGSGGGTAGSGGSGGNSTGGAGGSGGSGGANGGSGGGTGGVTGNGGAGGGTGGMTGNGGTTATGGSSGAGGSTAGICASAFFSADAASKKASEYSAWKTAFVQECTANGSAVVKNGGGVYSEGIGYGMLLAANNNDQALLDKLWKFYTDHLDANGLMNWSMDACAAPGNNNANAASDGDLDAAMGLVIADRVWGGYTSDARGLIGKIKQFETDSCTNGLVVLRPGDNWGGCSDKNNPGKVNPSYFSPGYYRVFATVDTSNASFWNQLATDSYTLLAQYQATMNGLVPEWGFNDGRVESSTYDYNACRTPWRIAMDYLWFCTPEAKTFLTKISAFVDGKGGVTKTGYANNSAFIGAFADSGIAISQAKIDAYEKDWMGNTGMDDTPYFQGTLRRLYLLVAAGQMLSGL